MATSVCPSTHPSLWHAPRSSMCVKNMDFVVPAPAPKQRVSNCCLNGKIGILIYTEEDVATVHRLQPMNHLVLFTVYNDWLTLLRCP